MFYHLFYPLAQQHIFFNVFRYITFSAVAAFITALLFTFFIGPKLINVLKQNKAVETINDEVPDTHKLKQGTPTMGGLIILTGILLSTLLWNNLLNANILLLLLTVLWLGGIGFLDDYLKNFLSEKCGLVPQYKLLGQIALGLIIGTALYFMPNNGDISAISMPFFKNTFIHLSWFFIPFVIFMITGTSNAVNLTDGLDGLAAGTVSIACFGLGIMAYIKGHYVIADYLNMEFLPESGEVAIFAASMIGTTLGFLWYNTRPAQIFMGDTGSLPLGGLLALISIILKEEIFFAIIGLIFITEACSSLMQRYYFKYSRRKTGEGQRLFKKAPLHHHYEMLGISEEKIVVRFWIIAVLLVAIGLGTLKLR